MSLCSWLHVFLCSSMRCPWRQNLRPVAALEWVTHSHSPSEVSTPQDGSPIDHSPSGLSLLWHEVPPSKSASLPMSSVMSPSAYLLHVSFMSPLFHLSSQQLPLLICLSSSAKFSLDWWQTWEMMGCFSPFQISPWCFPHG